MIQDLREGPEAGQIDDRARFDIIRYANCWEDSRLLIEALEPGPGHRVLSIASAGDNSLDILSTGAEVVAVDLSLPQLAALELRVAAFRHLDYDDLLGFLGVHEDPRRRTIYGDLRADLSETSREFWDHHRDSVDAGIIFDGKFEHYFRTFRERVLPLVHNQDRIDALLQEKTEAERRAFYDETWNSKRWRLLFNVFFSRRVMGWLGRDPEFFRYVEGPVSQEILRRAERALKVLSTHDNPYLTFILRGNFDGALPPYLVPEKYEAIREHLDGLTLCRGTVEDAARHFGDDGFSGYNLSDIFEYMDEDTARACFEALTDAARPGARLAYWNMMVPRQGAAILPERLTYLRELSEELHTKDRAFFYGAFHVDERSP